MRKPRPAARPQPQWTRIHASCVLVGRSGVLLRGPSGSGKSALVIGLLATAAPNRLVRLVADDAVELAASGGRLLGRTPPATMGLIEVRGVGLVRHAAEPRAVIGLLVDLVSDAQPERLPEERVGQAEFLGLAVPRLVLPYQTSGNVATVLVALAALDAGESLPVVPRSGAA